MLALLNYLEMLDYNGNYSYYHTKTDNITYFDNATLAYFLNCILATLGRDAHCSAISQDESRAAFVVMPSLINNNQLKTRLESGNSFFLSSANKPLI